MPQIIIPDSLFALALQFKRAKLWNLLWDSELFAVHMRDGQIGYCSVMGRNKTHYALGLYMGDAGLDSYRVLAKGPDIDVVDEYDEIIPTFQNHEHMMMQDCIQCAFEDKEYVHDESVAAAKDYAKRQGIKLTGSHAYPNFIRYRPFFYPWLIRDEKELDYMAQALSAAIEVSERIQRDVEACKVEHPSASTREARDAIRFKLGFSEGALFIKSIPMLRKAQNGEFEWSLTTLPQQKEPSYSSPQFDANDLLLTRLKRSKLKQTAFWYCDLVMLPEPICDEEVPDGQAPVSAPYFPFALLVFESGSWQILTSILTPNLERENLENMLRQFAQSMIDHGKPKEIVIREKDERTWGVLKSFCKQAGVSMRRCQSETDEDYAFLDAEIGLLDVMSDKGECNNDSSSGAEYEQMLRQLTIQLAAMTDDSLRTMPNELRDVLLEEAHAGRLDAKLAQRIIRIFEKHR